MQRREHSEGPDKKCGLKGLEATTAPAARARSRALLCLALAALLTAAPGARADERPAEDAVRLAVFNVWELSARKALPAEGDADAPGASPQLRSAAEILQRVRPDVLLLLEVDYADDDRVLRAFRERFLGVSQSGQEPLVYPHSWTGPVNTGVPSGYDLNNDGSTESPDDGWGFGRYPGQYGMALLSRFPIDARGVRSFRGQRWIAMPGHLMPDGRDGRPEWYSPEEAALLRLSSKSLWDVPLEIEGRRLHVLASHPTPPVFDGEEDRNGRRNFDEIRMVADYLSGGEAASWMVDDLGQRGGLTPAASVVVLGDLNADPVRSPAEYGRPAIDQLLSHPRLVDPVPRSVGRIDPPSSSRRPPYPGDRRTLTSGFGRIDYALPSRNLEVVASGVYVPEEGSPERRLVEGEARASDHYLVWIDLALTPQEKPQ
ncbi:MAG: endonuclease/exonuclease/phosphatase family protein [Acidobacteriota bacterium]